MAVLENTCTIYGMKSILEELSEQGSIDFSKYDQETQESLQHILSTLEIRFTIENETFWICFPDLQRKKRVLCMINIFSNLLYEGEYSSSMGIPLSVYEAMNEFLISIKCPFSISKEKVTLHC